LRPYISPSLPKGIMSGAIASKKEVLIHPRRIGPMANSCPIEGRATVIDDAIKGPLKQVGMATMRAARWEVCIVSIVVR
jgi:hypothetical protein